MLSARHRHAA